MSLTLTASAAKKRAARRRLLKVDNREASNRVDRSHSSRRLDAVVIESEALREGYGGRGRPPEAAAL
jgi:hypothetical protein